jgi:phosphoglucosamine mutase
VSAGLASSGIDVWDAGVVPTPACAYLVRDGGFDFGVMVSASHNPAPDNGIKFFSFGGTKLPDEVEDRIEGAMVKQALSPTGAGVGRIKRFADAEDRYVMHLLSTLDRDLTGLHVVLDCAHGAASGISPRVFRDAGATVTVIGDDPDGLNINKGYGSTHLENLQTTVLSVGADFGIAHDGDADRALAIDHTGRVIDGDHIMAILALGMKEEGTLTSDTLVATVMSNLGLRKSMAQHGITLIESAVGDRYVLEDLATSGASLGGEQSGHIILTEHSTTGDGILTGIQLAREVVRTGKTLAELADVMDVYPQVLINVSGVDRSRLADDDEVQAAIVAAEAELGDTGRVLLRPSGTEALIRVMVEAADESTATRVAESLAAVVKDRLQT